MANLPKYYSENILEKYFCIDFPLYANSFGVLNSEDGKYYQQVNIDMRRCDYDQQRVSRNECKSKQDIDDKLSNIALWLNSNQKLLDFSNFENPYDSYLKEATIDKPAQFNMQTNILLRNLKIISDVGWVFQDYQFTESSEIISRQNIITSEANSIFKINIYQERSK